MLRTVLLSLLSIVAAYGQSPAQKQYVVSIGTSFAKVASGTVWLYSHSWYGLLKLQWATIKDGVALVSLDAEKLKSELDPNPTTDGYVVAVQVGEHQWWRSPDIPPDRFWSDLPSAVNSLGRATTSQTGDSQLILPSLVKRHLTLVYPDGRPAVDAEVVVSIYLWDTNHCGAHEGFPLGTFHTDATGTIEVAAPLVPLYLDGISYYEVVGNGLAGSAYSNNFGLKTSAEPNVVLKEQWQFKDEDDLSEAAEIRVLTADGRPRDNVDVYLGWLTNTCGGHDRVGRTDSNGLAQIGLDPSVTSVMLMIGGPYSAGDPRGQENSRDLGSAELQELFSKHKLTIRW